MSVSLHCTSHIQETRCHQGSSRCSEGCSSARALQCPSMTPRTKFWFELAVCTELHRVFTVVGGGYRRLRPEKIEKNAAWPGPGAIDLASEANADL